ncbi:MAG: DNA repair protein RecN [Acidobacteriota bacterium]|nr:MAG: DNA repair protein RecN [Acidobacteriota bacterium]
MLRFISIDNFALIDHLEVEFGSGLNLITGETGSGKSILVDAVGLLVGARASQEMIRQGSETARIEGLFSLEGSSSLDSVLAEQGIEMEGSDLIIRREVSRTGSNRIFVNGQLSTLAFLARIGRELVDIHGQHSQHLLLNPSSHLELLDLFGRNQDALAELARLFGEFQARRAELETLRGSEQERLQRIDLLRFQVQEIDRLKLSPGLDAELETEKELLASAEERLQLATGGYDLLYDRDDSVLAQIEQASRQIEELCRLDANFESPLARLQESRYQLEEIAFQLRDYLSDIEFNPRRLDQVEERMAEIEKVRRKYADSVDGLLEYRDEIETELRRLEDFDQESTRLAARIEPLFQSCLEQARRLSDKRRADSEALSAAVERELADLAMGQTVFRVLLESDPERLSEEGFDRGEFLISPNPGEEPKPLLKIASGGELSRLMLALKAALEEKRSTKSLVFDEVDSGIGGRTATSLGQKLLKVSAENQVFCVTHLPQVARFAHLHYHVGKQTRNGRTIVEITRLSQEERVEELSRMMAGASVTETTRRQARELLELQS